MATIVKDLGAVTAYAYAVEKGYTGTEDEFAELMASYADVAEQAAESAAQAGASATAAEQAKANAASSASAAASSASTASTKASEAASSASSAAGSANTATTKANEASTSATNAASSASAAATSATNAGASETAAAGSASSAETAKTAAETAQGKAEDAQTAAEDAAEQAGIYAAGYLKAFPVDTASGAVANFPDGADELPAKDLTVAIEPSQSGSGDPSPDNVRPISGWTGANVTRTGRNLLDTKNYAPSSTTSSGITIVQNQDGSFKVSGTATGVVNLWLRGAWGGTNPVLKLYAGKTYFIKDCMLYNGTSVIGSAVNMGQTGTYTPSADIEVTGVRASAPNGTTLDTTIYPYVTDSADTEWQPFGDTYSITFPSEAGTVYGGTLDVTTGKLTVDRAMVTFNGTEDWRKDTYIYLTGYSGRTAVNGACSHFPYIKTAAVYSSSGVGISTWAFIVGSGVAANYTAAEWKAFLSEQAANNTPVMIVYGISTPIVYDLTPTEVTTLLGTNNVWADTGDSTVEYRADPTLYINKKIAALAAAMN